MKLRFIKPKLKFEEEWLERWRGNLINAPENEKWYHYDQIAECQSLIDKYQKNIMFIKKRLKSLEDGKNEPVRVDIEQIREIPIKTVLDHLGHRPDARGWYKCPFHAENSSSAHIMPRGNRFKCFGCGINYSVIDIIIHSQKINVGEAIKYLSTYL